MKRKINEGDIVLYVSMNKVEIGRVASIVREKDHFHIVPLERGHHAKKRKESELFSLDRAKELSENHLHHSRQ